MAVFGLDASLQTLPPEFALLRAGGESTIVSAEWLRSPAGVAGLIMRLPGSGPMNRTCAGPTRISPPCSSQSWARHSLSCGG